jgi:hypothetical protein
MSIPNLIAELLPYIPVFRILTKAYYEILGLLLALFLVGWGIYYNIHILIMNINNQDYDKLRANIIHYIVYGSIGFIIGLGVFALWAFKIIKELRKP